MKRLIYLIVILPILFLLPGSSKSVDEQDIPLTQEQKEYAKHITNNSYELFTANWINSYTLTVTLRESFYDPGIMDIERFESYASSFARQGYLKLNKDMCVKFIIPKLGEQTEQCFMEDKASIEKKYQLTDKHKQIAYKIKSTVEGVSSVTWFNSSLLQITVEPESENKAKKEAVTILPWVYDQLGKDICVVFVDSNQKELAHECYGAGDGSPQHHNL